MLQGKTLWPKDKLVACVVLTSSDVMLTCEEIHVNINLLVLCHIRADIHIFSLQRFCSSQSTVLKFFSIICILD